MGPRADIGKFDSGTTCVLVPNTTVGGILKASPFETLLAQQLSGVKRSLFYTITVCACRSTVEPVCFFSQKVQSSL